jgi:hypothetical protein
MVFLLFIVTPLVVLLVAAAFVDRRSRRVRGRVGRVRVPGGEVSHRMDAVAAERLSMWGSGPWVVQHAREPENRDLQGY